jgi:MarR family transcriptional regulator for hemolysin
MRPAHPPVGLHLARAARLVSRAFDDALSEAGGSLPVWLVLLNLKIRPAANQRELAEAVGIREATLTHHLNAMERDGLLTRRRDHINRRIHVVELTDAGETAFLRLRDAAVAFDRRLRRGITAEQLASLEGLLGRLVANVETNEGKAAPWAGLIESAP